MLGEVRDCEHPAGGGERGDGGGGEGTFVVGARSTLGDRGKAGEDASAHPGNRLVREGQAGANGKKIEG